MLDNDLTLSNLNQKYSSVLGRDNDPRLKTDISSMQLFIRKSIWTLLTLPKLDFIISFLYPKSTISQFNVNNAVALTIDDGFCGVDNPQGSMLKEVRELLKLNNAHATFFTVGSHCKNIPENQINELIKDGNEIANHNMMDWSYRRYSEKDFETDLLLNKNILSSYNQEYSSWYRAPFGQLSIKMQKVIEKHNMSHVLPNIFAHDTFIPDSSWISKYILNRISPGSVILIHMPEKGVREWNYEALEIVLEGLKEKELDILNLSEILRREKKNQRHN